MKHNISLVFQNYNLIDYLTTVENVKLGGSGNAEKLLEEVGIGKEYWQRNVYYDEENKIVLVQRNDITEDYESS